MELQFEGRATSSPLEFAPPSQTAQTLLLRDTGTPSAPTLFKVQCTSARRFRVRPTLGVVPSDAPVEIRIQLDPQVCSAAVQTDTSGCCVRFPRAKGSKLWVAYPDAAKEHEAAACKFLLTARTLPPSASTADADGTQLKALWTAAERQASTLVFSETVHARIRPVSSSGRYDAPALSPSETPPPPPPPTPQLVAELVLLLLKSQSRRPENALKPEERERLGTSRALHPTYWPRWEAYAGRLRTLVHERNRRLRTAAAAARRTLDDA
ncbi:hypothetical protein BBJ28_00012757 [Nothophytophthora sp. Chile5]|nr:hypothetical protein BBJ28_00012757 [Nothophytophthora sp. Chile5]